MNSNRKFFQKQCHRESGWSLLHSIEVIVDSVVVSLSFSTVISNHLPCLRGRSPRTHGKSNLTAPLGPRSPPARRCVCFMCHIMPVLNLKHTLMQVHEHKHFHQCESCLVGVQKVLAQGTTPYSPGELLFLNTSKNRMLESQCD